VLDLEMKLAAIAATGGVANGGETAKRKKADA
jgi:hypothetical protein